MKKIAIRLLDNAHQLRHARNGQVLESRVNKLATFLDSLNITPVEALYNVKIVISKYAGNPPEPKTILSSVKLGGTSGTYKKGADGARDQSMTGTYVVWAVVKK